MTIFHDIWKERSLRLGGAYKPLRRLTSWYIKLLNEQSWRSISLLFRQVTKLNYQRRLNSQLNCWSGHLCSWDLILWSFDALLTYYFGQFMWIAWNITSNQTDLIKAASNPYEGGNGDRCSVLLGLLRESQPQTGPRSVQPVLQVTSELRTDWHTPRYVIIGRNSPISCIRWSLIYCCRS